MITLNMAGKVARHNRRFIFVGDRFLPLDEDMATVEGSSAIDSFRAVRRRSRALFIAAIAIAMGFLGVILGTTCIPVSFCYCVNSSFTRLPENDSQLIEWLKEQPNVVAHTVQVRRYGAESRQLEVAFIQVRTALGQPRFPDLAGKCSELGYLSDGVGFSDCD
ncbi:MAG: hypothetical protein U0939_19545 [Pirellulales bacterium]